MSRLNSNSVLEPTKKSYNPIKKTRVGLPFIDDFSYSGPYPDAVLWTDNYAFINNTFAKGYITQGVATLDGLNQKGRPYFSNPNSVGYADSLTSQPIDLSSYTALSNVFMSFFYQPQGLGFAPENQDTLFLFFKDNTNQWNNVWRMRGSAYQDFRYEIFPILDAKYFHSNFQFRFVNIASLDINNDTWNIDYVKIDANRSLTDSINNDIAFTTNPTSILFPYQSMPYRHFIANQTVEKAPTHSASIRNLYSNSNITTTSVESKETISLTPIANQTLSPTTIPAYTNWIQSFNAYNISYSAPNNFSKVEIENKYYFTSVNVADRKQNDTIKNTVVFDNYFSYDDGSAEKSYFLLPATNFAAKTALEFHLNQPDSIRGLMVHFGPQVPSGNGKLFSIVLYKTIAGNGLSDSIIAQRDFIGLKYVDTINGFSSFAFNEPKWLDAGNYYIGITQPANLGSDSIYYGLDVNTNANLQYLYYNVNGSWLSSQVEGSIMLRPIVGQAFTPTKITEIKQNNIAVVEIFPNPVVNSFSIKSKQKVEAVKIISAFGTVVSKGKVVNNFYQFETLPNGFYFIELEDLEKNIYYQKIVIKNE